MKQTLQVSGMSCSHCVAAVTGALQEIGVQAQVSLAEKTVEVDYDTAKHSLTAITAAIEEQGYEVQGVVAAQRGF
jgi:copper chaperone